MNQVRFDHRNDVIDDLPLERESEVHRLVRIATIDLVPIIEDAVLCQMDARTGKHLVVFPQFLIMEMEDIPVKQAPIIRQCYMDVRAQRNQRGNQACRDIRKAASLRRHTLRGVAHRFRKIADFGGDQQDPRRPVFFKLAHHASVPLVSPPRSRPKSLTSSQ